MTALEHISYLAGLLAVGFIVWWGAYYGTPTQRRKRKERKTLELLVGGKR